MSRTLCGGGCQGSGRCCPTAGSGFNPWLGFRAAPAHTAPVKRAHTHSFTTVADRPQHGAGFIWPAQPHGGCESKTTTTTLLNSYPARPCRGKTCASLLLPFSPFAPFPRPSYEPCLPSEVYNPPEFAVAYEGVGRHTPRLVFPRFSWLTTQHSLLLWRPSSLPPPLPPSALTFSPTELLLSRLFLSPTGGRLVPCHLLREHSRGVSAHGFERLSLFSLCFFPFFPGSGGDLVGDCHPPFVPPLLTPTPPVAAIHR